MDSEVSPPPQTLVRAANSVSYCCPFCSRISTLLRLNLTNVNMTSEGARYVSDALCNIVMTCNIHTVILDHNPVG